MNWHASSATIQARFHAPRIVKPAHGFAVGELVLMIEAPGVYRRGVIVRANCWLGVVPCYSVRMAAGNVTHLYVAEHELRRPKQVYGFAA